MNKEKEKKYKKDYYQKNHEKRQEYVLKNHDKILEYAKNYFLRNKEKRLEYQKKYNFENKDKVSKWHKEYYLENLEYCTPSENAIHSYNVLGKQAARGERVNTAKLTEKQVIEIRQRYIQENISQRELGVNYGVKQGPINKIISRKTWDIEDD